MKNSKTSLKAKAQIRLADLTREAIEFNKPILPKSVSMLTEVIDEQISEILEMATDPVDRAAYSLLEANWDDWICDLENRIISAIDKT